MNPTIIKRPALESDTKFAHRVHHLAMHDVVIKQFGEWVEVDQDKWFIDSWLPKPNEIILINGVPGGYYSIEWHGDHVFINEVIILPEFQNQGIGTKIVGDIIKEAKQKKVPVRLQVLKENKAKNLYLKLGFKDAGTTDTHFQMELL